MRGYCCLVLKRHAVECRRGFCADARSAAGRRGASGDPEAVKLNYEIHGNTLPHLHVHLFLRYRGDPFEGGPINPELIKTSPYQGSEFTDFVKKLRAKLAEGTSH